MPKDTKLKIFWTRPTPLSLNAKELKFGYTDYTGKQKEYEVSQKGDDTESFHRFVFLLDNCKKKMILPWPVFVRNDDIQKKVKIDPPFKNLDSVQTELQFKVTSNYLKSL